MTGAHVQTEAQEDHRVRGARDACTCPPRATWPCQHAAIDRAPARRLATDARTMRAQLQLSPLGRYPRTRPEQTA
ncbi:unnamed protein product [Leptosia nina]|uniref:SWIM-type domain-containing protein n=1 Tax=Leptosia nina TaxID=320188 RepID=A0AAV1JTT3_9NEOP